MVLCTHCQDDALCIQDQDTRMTICCGCGKVVADTIYDEGVRFIQDANGNSRMDAERISSIHSGLSISRERTINKGKYEIEQLVRNLCVSGGDTIVNIACRYYELAVDHKFTRGRRTTHVAAACLYIACRQSDKPYLLIDFSEYLQISVYALGAVFLQLCQVLLLSAHPVFQKLIDPTLFIQRFTECLGVKKDKAKAVSNTAIQIVASMKRDWMQTGRKPSGICGAALYIAALSHGLDYTKADVVAVVHVCEATLTKRLIEFENTDSGALTMEEFEKADDFMKAPVSKHSPKSGEILCKHKDKCADYFAHGLCEECYDEFTKLSGGLEGGADPPAFQRAERKRIDTAKRAEEAGAINEAAPRNHFVTPVSVIENIIRTPRKEVVSDSILSKDPEDGGENFWDELDPESLSDIDEEEVEEYLHNEEERQYKKVIWEEINKEYLEEQAAKEALAAELAARGVVAEEVKKKKRRRSEDTKGSTPATPAEATRNMLKRKRPGSKINMEAVDRLYNPKDDNGDAHEKHKMDFDGEFAEDNGDGETFDHDYDYDDDNRDGYGYDGGGVDNDFDPFDFL
ncbi:hypothetical protein QOZ80_5BG0425280 [Eleusine coracana subsp. coracana]|nr:hypothetical protein QOZ80_5BG0425280 [Eleusine coracana subsp. coracana]